MQMKAFPKLKSKRIFRMMSDAEHGLFDIVVVKDISRFARNTVDLLQNVHKLKSLEIEPQFLMKYILEKSSMASKKFESDIQ